MANQHSHGARLQVLVMHKECLHNHSAPHVNGHVRDGRGLFEARGPNGTPEAMLCAACRCHRNFHRRVEVDLPRHHKITHSPPQPQAHRETFTRHAPASVPGLEINILPPQPQARRETFTTSAPASAPGPETTHSPHRFSNVPVHRSPGRRRKRLTRAQGERIRAIVERNDWRIFKEYPKDEVTQICSEIEIKRSNLKDWISKHRREREKARQAASN